MNKRIWCIGLLWIILTGCTHLAENSIGETAHSTTAETHVPESEMDTIQQEWTEPEPAEESLVEPDEEQEVVVQTLSFTIDTVGDFVSVGDGESYDLVKEPQNDTIRYKIDLVIPSAWKMSGTVAMDEEREKAEIFSTKRMEYYSFLYRTSDISENAVESTTTAGATFYTWDEPSSTMDGYGVIYTHAVFPLATENETFWFHIYFLTYSDDRAGYYEEVTMPIINGLQYVQVEPDAALQ